MYSTTKTYQFCLWKYFSDWDFKVFFFFFYCELYNIKTRPVSGRAVYFCVTTVTHHSHKHSTIYRELYTQHTWSKDRGDTRGRDKTQSCPLTHQHETDINLLILLSKGIFRLELFSTVASDSDWKQQLYPTETLYRKWSQCGPKRTQTDPPTWRTLKVWAKQLLLCMLGCGWVKSTVVSN